ncbi:MAG: type II toxin-antitoxin system PemK/MazF family toxin [Desulfobacterales bacterium]|jgi:mRNA interferase MazF|nr:type II toxin-antitoxin system PemK/MazF family toxin [Desulfobacterales bacterium]
MTTCRRGEVWIVNFSPGRGSEQKGNRPALIIQNDVGNQYASTTIVAAITTTIKKYPVTVLIPGGKDGLKENSMVNLAQILTIDKERLRKKLGYVGEERMAEVNEAIRISLGIK